MNIWFCSLICVLPRTEASGEYLGFRGCILSLWGSYRCYESVKTTGTPHAFVGISECWFRGTALLHLPAGGRWQSYDSVRQVWGVVSWEWHLMMRREWTGMCVPLVPLKVWVTLPILFLFAEDIGAESEGVTHRSWRERSQPKRGAPGRRVSLLPTSRVEWPSRRI